MLVWQNALVGGEYDQYWQNVTLALKIDASGVSNVKTGTVFTLGGGATVTTTNAAKGNSHSLLFPGTGSPYASIANAPSLVMGSGDFTIEWSFVPSAVRAGNGSGSTSFFWPAFFWGTWASPGFAINLNAWYNHANGSVGLIMNNHTGGIYGSGANTPITMNTVCDMAVVRKNGQPSFYVNGIRVGSPQAHSVNNTNTTVQPFYLGRMYGGGDGSVVWSAAGNLQSLRFTKGIARYDGTSYVVPSVFHLR